MLLQTIAALGVAAASFLSPAPSSAPEAYAARSLSPTASSYGYVVTDYDADLLLARQNLDKFWGDPGRAPGAENPWYTAPGFSWLNEAGGTATPCGNLEPAEAEREAFFYCPVNKAIYVDYSRLRQLHASWGYDGVLAMLAHEYGHHLQNLRRVNLPTTRQEELQADCLAGTALRWFTTGMPNLNRAELGRLAFSTGGGDHGTGAERQRWWLYGWDNYSYSSTTLADQFACFRATYY